MELKIDAQDPDTIRRAAELVSVKVRDLLLAEDYSRSREQITNFLGVTKRILDKVPKGILPDTRNLALVSAILSRGLLDFTQLCEITSVESWGKDNQKVEQVWSLLIDTVERLEFVHEHLTNDVTTWILSRIEALREEYDKAYGPSIYFSTEIRHIDSRCSICGADCRACNHLAGTIYDGELCQYVPRDRQLIACNMVFFPKDPRCRLWPWNTKESSNPGYLLDTQGYVYTFFKLDDF